MFTACFSCINNKIQHICALHLGIYTRASLTEGLGCPPFSWQNVKLTVFFRCSTSMTPILSALCHDCLSMTRIFGCHSCPSCGQLTLSLVLFLFSCLPMSCLSSSYFSQQRVVSENHGRPQDFFNGWTNSGEKSHSGLQGWSPSDDRS